MASFVDLAFNPATSYSMLQPRYYYAMGNSPARDLTEGCPVPNEVRFLLLGCGDPRNVLYTVSELSQLERRPRILEFHMNDIDEVCLARDCVLLFIISDLNPNVEEDIEFLWAVWYNLHLYERQRKRLKSVLDKLLKNMDQTFTFKDKNAESSIKSVLESWINLSVSVKEVETQRENVIKTKHNCSTIVQAISQGFQLRDESMRILSGVGHEENETWQEELASYLRKGSCVEDRSETYSEMVLYVNPTLYCPLNQCWRVHYSSHPYFSYNGLLFDTQLSLQDNCKKQLKSLLTNWQDMKKYSEIKLVMWTGDALSLCLYRLPALERFHFIDTSNLCDTVALMNLLVCCTPRLTRKGVLLTQAFHLYRDCETPIDFLKDEIHCNETFFQSIFGVQLADSFEIGKDYLKNLADFQSMSKEVDIRWRNCYFNSTRIDIRGSPELLSAFKKVARGCLKAFRSRTDKRNDILLLRTPLTLILLIKRMSNRISGGVSTLISIAEECIQDSASVDGECVGPLKLEWNMLKYIHLNIKTRDEDNSPCIIRAPFFLPTLIQNTYGKESFFRVQINEVRKTQQGISRSHVVTLVHYYFEKRSVAFLLPQWYVESFKECSLIKICYIYGSPLTSSPIPLRNCDVADVENFTSALSSSWEETADAMIPEDDVGEVEMRGNIHVVTEGESAFYVTIHNTAGAYVVLSYTVIKQNTSLVTFTIQAIEMPSRKHAFSLQFSCFLQMHTSSCLIKPNNTHKVVLLKSELNNGIDVLPRRRLLSDSSTVRTNRILSLCRLTMQRQWGQPIPDSRHCDVREAFMTLFKVAAGVFQSGSVVGVNILLGLRNIDIQPVGMYPEDIVLYLLRISQQHGLPVIHCVWFDWEVLYQNDFYALRAQRKIHNINYLMEKMGYKCQEYNATLGVHEQVAKQIHRLLRMYTKCTDQTKGKEGEAVKWFFEASIKPIFPYHSNARHIIRMSEDVPFAQLQAAEVVDKSKMSQSHKTVICVDRSSGTMLVEEIEFLLSFKAEVKAGIGREIDLQGLCNNCQRTLPKRALLLQPIICKRCGSVAYCSENCLKANAEKHGKTCPIHTAMKNLQSSRVEEGVYLCAECKKPGKDYRSCGACKEVRYCSRECQKKNWSIHKPFCRRQ